MCEQAKKRKHPPRSGVGCWQYGRTNDKKRSLGASCKKCQGDELCPAHKRERHIRELAVRVLRCKSWPDGSDNEHFREDYSALEYEEGLAMVDDMAERIMSGAVAIPVGRLIPKRKSDKLGRFRDRMGEGVYRAFGNGCHQGINGL